MKMVEIKNRFYGTVIVSGMYDNISDCLEKNRSIDFFCANLFGAWLGCADLRGADLKGAKLEGAKIKVQGSKDYILNKDSTIFSVIGLAYPVVYIDHYIKIGCVMHTYDEWANFTDGEILQKSSEDNLLFWKEWKNHILSIRRTNNEKDIR